MLTKQPTAAGKGSLSGTTDALGHTSYSLSCRREGEYHDMGLWSRPPSESISVNSLKSSPSPQTTCCKCKHMDCNPAPSFLRDTSTQMCSCCQLKAPALLQEMLPPAFPSAAIMPPAKRWVPGGRNKDLPQHLLKQHSNVSHHTHFTEL